MPSKPSREVRVGDLLKLKNDGGVYHIEVRDLSEIRGPASVAQLLYSESEASRAARLQAAEERRAMPAVELPPPTKPSKRDRRKIARLRGI